MMALFTWRTRRGERAAEEAAVGSGLVVANVDDDGTAREAVRRALEGAGFTVASFESYESWLAAWESGLRPSCVVMDIMLDGRKSGYELLRLLRKSGSRVPVVMLSSRNTATDDRYALASGANGFVTKAGGEFDHPDRGLVAKVVALTRCT